MIWVAEYKDGNIFTSYDLETKEKNDFYDIDKKNLRKYGFIGNGKRYYFNANDGQFFIGGNKVNAEYKLKDKTIKFNTMMNGPFNDIIQYKDANAVMGKDVASILGEDGIVSYNFGYKAKMRIEGIEFYYKTICMIRYSGDVKMYFRLVSDQDISGKFIVNKNNKAEFSKKLSLKKEHSKEFSFIL